MLLFVLYIPKGLFGMILSSRGRSELNPVSGFQSKTFSGYVWLRRDISLLKMWITGKYLFKLSLSYGFRNILLGGSLLNEQQSPSSVKSLLNKSSQFFCSLDHSHFLIISEQELPVWKWKVIFLVYQIM